jgi:tripeptide aminopeptidase
MSLKDYTHTVAERFMRYVQIDTEADPNSETQPSSEKQKDLSRLLVDELIAMGIGDAVLDQYGYVYASIPATIDKEVPVLCFCSHVDTAPDVTGANVKPVMHKNFDGSPILFTDDATLILSMEDHPYLKERLGDDIITASGKTLLGADNKAGVAIIMDLAAYLIKHPEVPHGKIRILFTPDEEIGRGVNKVDMEKLGADFGYTLDGGPRGVLEGESFSADGATVIFEGISAHPGYAKDKMVNAIKIASHFMDSLPKDSWCPERTNGREAFVHPVHMDAAVENAIIHFIVRDFETSKLAEHEARLEDYAKATCAAFPGTKYTFTVKEQYRNMREMLDRHPQVMAHAMEAYKRAGMNPVTESIRGGTDGSRLSFMGMPCPNIFTGEMAIHSRKEYVSIQDMEKAVETLVHLSNIWAE